MIHCLSYFRAYLGCPHHLLGTHVFHVACCRAGLAVKPTPGSPSHSMPALGMTSSTSSGSLGSGSAHRWVIGFCPPFMQSDDLQWRLEHPPDSADFHWLTPTSFIIPCQLQLPIQLLSVCSFSRACTATKALFFIQTSPYYFLNWRFCMCCFHFPTHADRLPQAAPAFLLRLPLLLPPVSRQLHFLVSTPRHQRIPADHLVSSSTLFGKIHPDRVSLADENVLHMSFPLSHWPALKNYTSAGHQTVI